MIYHRYGIHIHDIQKQKKNSKSQRLKKNYYTKDSGGGIDPDPSGFAPIELRLRENKINLSHNNINNYFYKVNYFDFETNPYFLILKKEIK